MSNRSNNPNPYEALLTPEENRLVTDLGHKFIADSHAAFERSFALIDARLPAQIASMSWPASAARTWINCTISAALINRGIDPIECPVEEYERNLDELISALRNVCLTDHIRRNQTNVN